MGNHCAHKRAESEMTGGWDITWPRYHGQMRDHAASMTPPNACTSSVEDDTRAGNSLPYGVVMATAGASALARACGLPALTAPLLALAIAQAVYIPLTGVWRQHRTWRAQWAMGSPSQLAGVHTVPLGLAVISGGLGDLGASDVAPWLEPVAIFSLVLAWVLTLVCIGRFAWSLMTRGMHLETVDGAWFLVPAALLGTGMATLTLADSGSVVWTWLALGSVLGGWAGYCATAIAAATRIRRCGIRGVAQAPWWIAMGCAGLAVAALGHLLHAHDPGPMLHAGLAAVMLATAVLAVILCVPIVGGSVRFLCLNCRFRALAAWPPTFSTAVFAFGCLQAGEVLSLPAFRWLGFGAGCATLVFWATTTGWNVAHHCANRMSGRRNGVE